MNEKLVIYGLHCTCHAEGVRYVGQTIRGAEVRLRSHLYDASRGRQTGVARWIRKHGAVNIRSTILATAECREDLNNLEKLWIERLRPNGLVNMTIGGDSVQRLTDEQVREIRAEYAGGAYQAALGKKYGVSQALIGNVVRGEYAGGENLARSGLGRTKTKGKTRGESNSQSKLSAWDVMLIRQQATMGIPSTRIAEQFGIHYGQTRAIITRKQWKHLPDPPTKNC